MVTRMPRPGLEPGPDPGPPIFPPSPIAPILISIKRYVITSVLTAKTRHTGVVTNAQIEQLLLHTGEQEIGQSNKTDLLTRSD